MSNQIRTQPDFFLASSSSTETPFPSSHIESFSFEDHSSQFSRNQPQDSSELDSYSVDSDPHQPNCDYFSTPQPGLSNLHRFDSSNQMVSDRRVQDYLIISGASSQSQNNLVMPKRKSNICLSRENIMKHWTQGDDHELMTLADQYKNDWKKIARRITSNRKKKVTPNFLKNRYKEIAGDHIKKGVKFTHEEDLEIARLFEIHGTSWTHIAHQFKDRTPVMIKNRYYSHIRRKGLLQDLVSEAQGKTLNSEEGIEDEDFIGFDGSSTATPQFQEVENLENSILNQSEANDLEDCCDEFNYLRDFPLVPQNRYVSYFGEDMGLCNLQNNNFEDDLKVRVTELKFSEHNFQ